MGLLDSILGGLMGGQSAPAPIQSILGSLLGGGATQQGQVQPGLGGLLQRFQQAGLGNVAQSWVGNGPNQPVEPHQLQQVFGQEQVGQWAQQTGMAPNALLSALSSFLPHAVDQMTPNGHVPTESGSPFDEAGTDISGSGRTMRA